MHQLLPVIKYLFIFLCFASFVGLVLNKLTPEASPKKATVLNLKQRIDAWWVMVSVLTSVFWAGYTLTILFFFNIVYYWV